MTDAPPDSPTAEDWARCLWREIESALAAEKSRLYAEIRSYPTPIAGCDLQFNDLLERQANLAADLRRLQAAILPPDAAAPGAGEADCLASVLRFLESSSFEPSVRDRLRARLNTAVSP